MSTDGWPGPEAAEIGALLSGLNSPRFTPILCRQTDSLESP